MTRNFVIAGPDPAIHAGLTAFAAVQHERPGQARWRPRTGSFACKAPQFGVMFAPQHRSPEGQTAPWSLSDTA
ncbi:MAG TPA: hypothetical protein VKK06_13990, partial [Terriglobia bacterium]|nr:hypothetical protein [Terriglobia bacterium]